MLGIEIVGFVLESLSFVTSVLEHYRDGLNPLKGYIRNDRTLKTFRTRLMLQQVL